MAEGLVSTQLASSRAAAERVSSSRLVLEHEVTGLDWLTEVGQQKQVNYNQGFYMSPAGGKVLAKESEAQRKLLCRVSYPFDCRPALTFSQRKQAL